MDGATLTTSEMLLRIGAAAIAGMVIGLERESRGRPAGLRTTLLTCAAAAIAMILSEYYYFQSIRLGMSTGWRPDPTRIGAGVLTGIGFLGAGTILRHENTIRGVTTAATLWFATVMGLAFGSGLFLLGAVSTGVAVVTLVVLPGFEKQIRSNWYARVQVTAELDALTPMELEKRLKTLGLTVVRTQWRYDLSARQQSICCEVKIDRQCISELSNQTLAELRLCKGVLQVEWT